MRAAIGKIDATTEQNAALVEQAAAAAGSLASEARSLTESVNVFKLPAESDGALGVMRRAVA